MKILLINPPRSMANKVLEYAPEQAKRFIHKKLIGPPLGLLTVAGAVKDYDVTVFDMKGEYDLEPDTPNLKELTQKILNQYKPDIVGVTFIASELYYGIDIFKEVKIYNPDILTVAGGLHTTLCPDDFLDNSIDIVCPGQSAHRFREIVISKEKKQNYENIEGILINTKKGSFKKTKELSKIINPASEGFIIPDRNHLKKWISTYRVGGNTVSSTYIYTSLGCPYKCTFCSIWPQFCGEYYQRDVESIITELKSIDDYPIVRFADANTIVNIKFIEQLFTRIEEENIKKEIIMDIRADTAVKYPKLIERLAKNGLKIVICGFESFREDELKKYNKSSPAHLNIEAIKVFHEYGVNLRGSYVIPNDYSEDDFKRMSEYSNSHKVVYASYSILTPMPGTEFYTEIKHDIVDHDLTKYNFFNCVLKTKLPLENFYENVGKLWLIKKGDDVLS